MYISLFIQQTLSNRDDVIYHKDYLLHILFMLDLVLISNSVMSFTCVLCPGYDGKCGRFRLTPRVNQRFIVSGKNGVTPPIFTVTGSDLIVNTFSVELRRVFFTLSA